MDTKLIDLSEAQSSDIDDLLESYDAAFLGEVPSGDVNIGLMYEGELVAGAVASMTSFMILYVSTLYVEEAFRGRGLGRKLLEAIEERARELDAKYIRLDTFDWQGVDFYRAVGYEQVGTYDGDGFSEFFFLKRL